MYISRLGNALTAGAPEAADSPLFGVPVCGEPDEPGVGGDNAEWVDYSQMPISTPDQQRIEAFLERCNLAKVRLLHVGIGNSFLAARFSPRCAAIDGITVSERERARAAGLGLSNYRAFRVNKYSVALCSVLSGPYDVIVDNNLASFACCGFHLMVMFSSYRHLLRPGGVILTDEQGMNWSAGEARWRLTPNDLQRVARRLGMGLQCVAESVWAMSRG